MPARLRLRKRIEELLGSASVHALRVATGVGKTEIAARCRRRTYSGENVKGAGGLCRADPPTPARISPPSSGNTASGQRSGVVAQPSPRTAARYAMTRRR